jgi:hypothetical protein
MSIFVKDFQSYSELQGYCGGTASPGLYFVKIDETKDNKPTQYFYDGTNIVVISGNPKSSEVELINSSSNFTATTVEGALNELFQNVNNGKQMIATAIVDKGGQVTVANTFEELSMAISTLSSGGSSNLNKKTIDYPNKKINDIEYLLVTEQLQSADQIILTMYKFVPEVNGTTILVEKYEGVSNFNTFDINIFEMIDNKLQTKRSKTFTSTETEIHDTITYYIYDLDLTYIENIEKVM